LIELDEVPEIPARLGHRLVSVVEGGQGERQVVPLGAGYFARFAADAGGGVDQFADFKIALHAEAGRGTGMARDHFGLQCLAVWHLPILACLWNAGRPARTLTSLGDGRGDRPSTD